MAHNEMVQGNSVNAGNWQSLLPEAGFSSENPPPWLAASVAQFRGTQRLLKVVRPIRAAAFGGTLVFVTLLALLLRHSPDGQSLLLAVSLWGLPLCLATWFLASSAQKRLSRKKHHIEQRMYGVGMHLDDQGRVLTDNPHPVLILDPATGSTPSMS
jgi:hypothetical protein